ncbi:hypothetical protein BDZ85DRAFT_30624 [Elsinoe ampelina]|uniref:Uncharacterized protein n=1 Tax=Elsinoe ampelina TaxID=302913 RepID=A0A6A6G589_9PEZI|nr:hypothetical protein BDZ85DRAFT_30624 [Elsinoe ampelina]
MVYLLHIPWNEICIKFRPFGGKQRRRQQSRYVRHVCLVDVEAAMPQRFKMSCSSDTVTDLDRFITSGVEGMQYPQRTSATCAYSSGGIRVARRGENLVDGKLSVNPRNPSLVLEISDSFDCVRRVWVAEPFRHSLQGIFMELSGFEAILTRGRREVQIARLVGGK